MPQFVLLENKRVERDDFQESFHPEILWVGDSSEPSRQGETHLSWEAERAQRTSGDGWQGRPTLLLSVSLAKADPGDSDPASLPPMSLLLSAALSFSPFGAPPPARRDWSPPRCPDSTRLPGSPAPALGASRSPGRGAAPRAAPPAARRSRAGPACEPTRGCAWPGLRSATAWAGLNAPAEERVGPGDWPAARRTGKIRPHYTQICTHAFIAGSWSSRRDRCHPAFSPRLCVLSCPAAPKP